jgi:hypothetical protein
MGCGIKDWTWFCNEISAYPLFIALYSIFVCLYDNGNI